MKIVKNKKVTVILRIWMASITGGHEILYFGFFSFSHSPVGVPYFIKILRGSFGHIQGVSVSMQNYPKSTLAD